MLPLARAIGLKVVWYDASWKPVERWSWTAGHVLRRIGVWYYGSEWNWLLPLWGEIGLLRRAARRQPRIIHFLWAEFAHPSGLLQSVWKRWVIIGTFHCSRRRLNRVIRRRSWLSHFDMITLVSQSQKPFFIDNGVPEERLFTVLHGVDTDYFCPHPVTLPKTGRGPLRALLVGSTERDHAFAAEVFTRLPRGVAVLRVATDPEYVRLFYRGAKNVEILGHLDDAGLLDEYRRADILFMPLLDCTANNALLEAMACGTPVLVSRVGGVPEYVCHDCNIVMDDKKTEDWIEMLRYLRTRRDLLAELRPKVRKWAERFDWKRISRDYVKVYEHAFSRQ